MTNVKIVIGGSFGDEGKGLMSAYFARQMMERSGKCLTVLSNGGAQRGHTVLEGEVRHVFRHFGSGTFAGADTYFPEEFIVNPMIFMKEYRELLKEAPEKIGPGKPVRVYIHPGCMITTPYEMITNLILEESRGSARHGSVGVGIWETVIGGGIRYGELTALPPKEQRIYLLCNRRERLYERLAGQGVTDIPQQWRQVLDNPELAEQYLEDLYAMREIVTPTDDTILREYPEVIFENGQGLLLDRAMIRKGYGHHTTPSHTGLKNPARILRDVYGEAAGSETPAVEAADPDPASAPGLVTEVVYVTRSYMTRHGAGRFDTECPVEQINPEICDLTNQPNESQGTLRFGRLNMQSLIRRARRDFESEAGRGTVPGTGSGRIPGTVPGTGSGRIPGTVPGTGSGRIPGAISWTVAMTHLNEYPLPDYGKKYIGYYSYSEIGKNCVIL